MLGLCLFAFYNGVPFQQLGLTSSDEIFPKFIVENLPTGLAGLVIAGVLLAVVVLAAGPALAQPKVLKISNGVNEQHPSYLAGKKFGEILAAKLPGKYDVQVYANAQLGDDVRATEGVRMGTLEMVTTSASPLTGLVPEFNVFDLPFIITSEKAADAMIVVIASPPRKCPNHL